MNRSEIIAFGEWMKQMRKKNALTQNALAERIGVAAGTISAIEVGKIAAIGPKLKRSIEEFFSDGSITPVVNPAVKTLQSIQNTGLEHLFPVLHRLADIVLADDFSRRIDSVASALDCSREDAVVAIFLRELQRNK